MSDIAALGMDAGSTTLKLVGVDREGNLAWHLLEDVDPYLEAQVARFLESACQEAGRSDLPLVATGYGRGLVKQAGRRVTEITCHARGIARSLGHGGTLVDIGGQDSKVIAITAQGDVIDFVMSDKCAAGTGRFLENTARRLNVSMDELGSLALSSKEEAAISSTCTVFAESEVISLLAHGTALPPILLGLHRSLVRRIMAMVRSVGLAPPLMLSGGVAKNAAVRRMLEEESHMPVILPDQPQLMGAYGAALLALGSA